MQSAKQKENNLERIKKSSVLHFAPFTLNSFFMI